MNSMQFDPLAFLDLPMDVPLEKRDALPVGDYTSVIKEVTARLWQGKKDPTKSGMAYDVLHSVEVPPEVRDALELTQSTLTLKDTIMLDLTETGALATTRGSNRALRLYREALDMNKSGETFRVSLMVGCPILVKVGHEVYNGAPVERITGVAKLGA